MKLTSFFSFHFKDARLSVEVKQEMSPTKLRICVIIPCYNAAEFLSEALESVQKQTRPPDEVIVVDDCSTDNSVEIARKFKVRILSTEKNSGPAKARNIGLNACQSDAIAWLDADDIWGNQHIEILAGLLESNPQAALAYSGVRAFGRRQFVWTNFPCEKYPANVIKNCFQATIAPGMAVLTRTEALSSIAGFDENMLVAPDFDAWLRLSFNHLFICTSKITALYRNHDRQISCNPNRQAKFVYQSRLNFIDFLKVKGEIKLYSELQDILSKIIESDLKKYTLRRNKEMREFLKKFLTKRTDIKKTWLIKILIGFRK